MKLIIAGSRDLYWGVFSITEVLAQAEIDDKITEVVSGCATGMDSCGEAWARTRGFPITSYPADWKTHDKAAGPIRNAQMADYADAALVIMRPGSRGSKNMIEEMLKRGKPIWVFTVM